MEYNPLALATREELLAELTRRSDTVFAVFAGLDTDDEPFVDCSVVGTQPNVQTLINTGVALANEDRTD